MEQLRFPGLGVQRDCGDTRRQEAQQSDAGLCLRRCPQGNPLGSRNASGNMCRPVPKLLVAKPVVFEPERLLLGGIEQRGKESVLHR
jgi:hypothetical protein